MIWPVKLVLLAALVLACGAAIALFVYLLVPALRSRSPRVVLRRASFLGLVLGVGLSLASGASIFAAGLVVTAPRLSFDHAQMEFAAVFVPFFAPFVAAFQLVVLAVAERIGLGGRLQTALSTAPILMAALVVVGLTLFAARPEERFEEFLGIRPPASVTNIIYEKETGFLYTHVVLTCRIDPQDAAEVLTARPDRVTVTYDRSTRTLKAEYSGD